MSNRFEIIIDPIISTNNYSVEISDHLNKTTKILDDVYTNSNDAYKAAQNYIKTIGARRQLGDNRSSK